jgi:multiple sugar transport system substrate-binding protein
VNQFVTFLALTCLLVTGRSAAALADDVPPPDTKCELVLFDFGDANDKQVRDAAIARFHTPYPNTNFNFGLAPFWYSNATAVLKDDLTESNLLDPNFLESVKFIRRLVHENGVSPDPANTNPNLVFQLFATGRIAMPGGGHWPIQFFNANRFNDYDIVPWPKNKAARTVFGADGWGISTKAKERAIAWKMVKELASTTSEQEAAELGVAIPARRTVAESPEFLAQPQHAALFYQTLSYAAPGQAPANYSVIEQILFRHLGQVLTDEVKPEDALKAADEELSAALKQPAAVSH